MVRARRALYRQLQEFFERELSAHFKWGSGVHHSAAEQATYVDPDRPSRVRPFGKHREMVVVKFGRYVLTAHSPNDKPPLGSVVLTFGGDSIEGPIDQVTWQRMGAFIRNQEHSNGSRRQHQPAGRSADDPIPGWGTGRL